MGISRIIGNNVASVGKLSTIGVGNIKSFYNNTNFAYKVSTDFSNDVIGAKPTVFDYTEGNPTIVQDGSVKACQVPNASVVRNVIDPYTDYFDISTTIKTISCPDQYMWVFTLSLTDGSYLGIGYWGYSAISLYRNGAIVSNSPNFTFSLNRPYALSILYNKGVITVKLDGETKVTFTSASSNVNMISFGSAWSTSRVMLINSINITSYK